MEQRHRKLCDILIMLIMVISVFLLCQPLGRNWDEGTEEMFTGEDGTYSYDSDSFYYLRKAKEFTENGFSSIRFFVSRADDPLVTFVSDDGEDSMPVLLSAIAAVIWYLFNAIGIQVGIYSVAMHLCGAILALCTMPLYVFLRKRVSCTAAICGAMLGTLSTAYLQHSITGIFDTDALIFLLALIIVLSFHECILAETKKEQITYGIASVIGTIILALTWEMFHIYVLIAIGTGICAILLTRCFFAKKEERVINLRIPFMVVFLMIALMLLMGWRGCYTVFRNTFSSVKRSGKWPSVYENVAEMARPGLLSKKSFWETFLGLKADYISYLGGLVAFVALLVFTVEFSCEVFRRKNRGATNREKLICRYFMVIIWFVGAAVLCFFGIRFTQFLILPASLIWAYGINAIEEKALSLTTAGRRILYLCCSFVLFATLVYASPVLALVGAGILIIVGFFVSKLREQRSVPIILCGSLILGVIVSAYLRVTLAVPLLEKPTVNAMTWIRDNTDKNAVIADFWSWGYRYQYYTERRTLADGGTYSGEMNYWLGNMMFTDDEKLSAGIARMLQASGVKGSEYAVELFGNEAKACAILKGILGLAHDDAKKYLKEQVGLSDEKCDSLLAYTHPEHTPDIYFIADQEGLRQSYSLGRFLLWNFTGDEVNVGTTMFTEESVVIPGKGEESVSKLWPKSLSSNYKISYKWEEDRIVGRLLDDYNRGYSFSKTIYIKEGERIYEIENSQSEKNEMLMEKSALIVFEEDGRLSAVIADERLINSVVFRLYLYDGKGQDTFTKVYGDEIPERISGEPLQIQRKLGTTNTRIYRNSGITVWKVQFE